MYEFEMARVAVRGGRSGGAARCMEWSVLQLLSRGRVCAPFACHAVSVRETREMRELCDCV